MDVFAALIEVEISGNDIFRPSSSLGAVLDRVIPDLDFTGTYDWDIWRIGIIGNPDRVNFADAVDRTVDAQTLFESGGEFAGGTVYIQDVAGVVGVQRSPISRTIGSGARE